MEDMTMVDTSTRSSTLSRRGMLGGLLGAGALLSAPPGLETVAAQPSSLALIDPKDNLKINEKSDTACACDTTSPSMVTLSILAG